MPAAATATAAATTTIATAAATTAAAPRCPPAPSQDVNQPEVELRNVEPDVTVDDDDSRVTNVVVVGVVAAAAQEVPSALHEAFAPGSAIHPEADAAGAWTSKDLQ